MFRGLIITLAEVAVETVLEPEVLVETVAAAVEKVEVEPMEAQILAAVAAVVICQGQRHLAVLEL
jgi:hypothetical protein